MGTPQIVSTLIGAHTFDSSLGQSVVFNLTNAAIAPGDLLLAFVSGRANEGAMNLVSGQVAMNGPTPFRGGDAGLGDSIGRFYWRVADGTESTQLRFANFYTTSGSYSSGQLVVVRSAHSEGPVAVTPVVTNYTSTVGSITAARGGLQIVAVTTGNSADVDISLAGFTELGESGHQSLGNGGSQSATYSRVVAAGATATATVVPTYTSGQSTYGTIAIVVGGADVAPETTRTVYGMSGNAQSYVVPSGVTSLTIDAYGAQGGSFGTYAGGRGGRTQGSITVTPGETLTVRVGGAGVSSNGSGGVYQSNAGGYNGGGAGGAGTAGGGTGGGGMTEVLRETTRLLVAAGGGGAGGASNANLSGGGGGLTGASGSASSAPNTATGGTQSVGGTNPTAGSGASVGTQTSGGTGGGGGASEYGGGGGGAGFWGGAGGGKGMSYGGSGGGGSALVPSGGSTTSDAKYGNGVLIITAAGAPILADYPTGQLTTGAPTLYATVTDADGGTLRAEFQVATDAGFTNVVFSGLGSSVTPGTSSSLKTSGLSASTLYYWRARTYDGALYSSYATAKTFTTSAPVTATFNHTGAVQTFTVPAGVTSLTVDLAGGAGYSYAGSAATGLGGRVQGSITVTPGETLNVYVGGVGGQSTGGFNGGGRGSHGPGGGGGTDIRRGTALTGRLAVAAGGGAIAGSGGIAGGHGGGTVGTAGANYENPTYGRQGGPGGTQTAGGALYTAGTGDAFNGSLGKGGDVFGSDTLYNYGGGGGGGYYGGGSGSTNEASHSGAGGGGGSSLVPAGGSTTTGYRGGHGYASLSYVNTSEAVNTAPTAPTITSPADNHKQRGVVTVAWTHNDVNNDAQGAYAFRRVKGGVTEYWTGTAWSSSEQFVQSSTTGVAFDNSAWPAGTYTYSVRTTDVFGEPGPYSTARTITLLSGMAMIV